MIIMNNDKLKLKINERTRALEDAREVNLNSSYKDKDSYSRCLGGIIELEGVLQLIDELKV